MTIAAHAGRVAGLVRLAFGGTANVDRVTLLAGDASVRSFHRMWFADPVATAPMGHGIATGSSQVSSVVLMHDPRPAADDGCGDDFVALERHLRHHGVGVPAIFAADREVGLYLLEDLGDRVLQEELREADPARRRELYGAVLEVLVVLARDASRAEPSQTPAHRRSFDVAKLGWELDFFLTHTVAGLWKIVLSASDRRALSGDFERLAATLAGLPRVFTHRDYHSRNLLIQGQATVRVVDFQDARMGPAVYDAASLLRDSYVELDEIEVAEWLEEHRRRLVDSGIEVPGPDAFREDFDRMSVQRGLKALGTFGFQATQRGKTAYLEAVPRTVRRVRACLSRLSDLGALAARLDPILSDLG